MVAIQPVGGNRGRGTPFLDRPELGAARSRTTEVVTWEDAVEDEETLLGLMKSMKEQMLEMEARWSMCQERKKKMSRSREEPELDTISPDLTAEDPDLGSTAAGDPDLVKNSLKQTYSTPVIVGVRPMSGDKTLSGSLKGLGTPSQDASPLTIEERNSYNLNGGEVRKKATRQMEVTVKGLAIPMVVDQSLMVALVGSNERERNNANRVFLEQVNL